MISERTSDLFYEFKKGNIEYLLNCEQTEIDDLIESGGELGLYKSDLMALIIILVQITTGTPKSSLSYIDKYISERKKFGYDKDDLMCLLGIILDNKLADKSYLYKYIENGEDYGLTKQDKLLLLGKMIESRLIELSDLDYYIENRNKYGFNKDDIINLIIRTKNVLYINKCLNRNKELEFSTRDCIKLAMVSNNNEYLNQFLSDSNTTLYLPETMTIGIEIEAVGEEAKYIRNIGRISGWIFKKDESVKSKEINEEGVEGILDNPLNANDNEKIAQMVRICTILQKLGLYTNDTCGGHIHIGANYLTNIQAWKNLMILWEKAESILFIIGNKRGEIPRNGIVGYAKPSSKKIKDFLNSNSISLQSSDDLKEFKQKIAEFVNDKYRAINFRNIEEGGLQTIEFRVSNGTLNPNTWIENIRLFGGIVKGAQDLSIIQQTPLTERTEQEQYILDCFKKIENMSLSERERLELLLQIIVPDNIRDTYRERYVENIKLIAKHPILERTIRNNDDEERLLDYIINAAIFDENRITGGEARVTDQSISKSLNEKAKGRY